MLRKRIGRSSPAPGGTPSRAITVAFATVGALAVVVLGLAWALATPIASSPDDDFHLASIWCDAGDATWCRRSGRSRSGIEQVLVRPAIGQGMGCYHPFPEMSAGCQRKALSESGLVRSRANDGLYPGGFYRLMSLLASSHVERSVVGMRMVSWLLAAALLVGAAALAGRDLRRAFAIAALTSFVPMGLFMFASNNPTGLMVAGVVAYWCVAYAYMDGSDHGPGWTVAATVTMVLSAVVALASRSDAGIYLGVASLAVWIAGRGYRPARRRRSLVLVAVSSVGALVALTVGQSRQAIEGGGTYEPPLTVLLFDNLRELPSLVLGSLGTYPLGSLDTPMPGVVSALMVLAFGGAVVGGLGLASKEKWIACGLLVGALVVLPMTVLVSSHLLVGFQGYVQPRYVLPLLPMLVGTAVMSVRGRPGIGLRRGQVVLIAGAVVVAHTAALHTTIRRYVTGLDERGPDLGVGVEWWWGTGPGPMAVWALGTTAFVVAVASVWAILGSQPGEGGSPERAVTGSGASRAELA